jgi:hypothetical protein
MRKQILYLLGALLVAPLMQAMQAPSNFACAKPKKVSSCDCEVSGRSFLQVITEFS